ncbi:hypothetical protein LPJ56_006781, partial [Coemansia sp. RSA 2599]
MLPLYTDEDPAYKATKQDMGIPPPNLVTLPQLVMYAKRSVDGTDRLVLVKPEEYYQASNGNGNGNGNYSTNGSRQNQSQQQQQQQQPRPQRSGNRQTAQQLQQVYVDLQKINFSHKYGGASPGQPYVDTIGKSYVAINNTYGNRFVKEHLCTAQWSRMMTEREDPRGRHANTKLVDIGQLQMVDAYKNLIARRPVDDRHESVVRARKHIVSKHPVDVPLFSLIAQSLNPYAGLAR